MNSQCIQKKTHPQVRLLRDIRDGKDKNFLFCEGEKPSHDLLRSHWEPTAVFCRPDTHTLAKSLLKEHKQENTSVHVLAENVMAYVSDLTTPPGLIVIAKRKTIHRSNTKTISNPLILVLHKQQLPQNLGGMIRSAEAAGVDQVWVTSNTVDPFHPKVIRGSTGSVFRVPIRQDGDLKTYISDLKKNSILTLAADQNGTSDYETLDWCKPVALVMGAEGYGLTKEELNLVDNVVRIPMKGTLESMNVGVAAAVCLFEAARQRRNPSC